MEQSSNLEKKLARKQMALSLGDSGIWVGASIALGYSLIPNDLESGNYVSSVVAMFIEKSLNFIPGCIALGYSLGRAMDILDIRNSRRKTKTNC